MSSEIASIVHIPDFFPFQSYFNAAAEGTTPPSSAVLVQPSDDPIIPSTLRKRTGQSGYMLGLAPWSEAPVAVAFDLGPAGKASPIILKPGQVIAPASGQKFKGFDYGLPFGWLGGGAITLALLKTPDAKVDWTGIQSEVLFHRFRTTILTGPIAANSLVPNWPNRFPWPALYRYDGANPPATQNAKAVISIAEVTRTLLRLNVGATDITNDNACSMLFYGTDHFSIGADGITPVNTDEFFYDIQWPVNATVVVGARNPLVFLPREIAAVAANTYGVRIYAPIGSALIGKTVDICRYGRL